MGSVIVRVGCPHRLRQPITSRTATPCDACAAFGAPGWPREAWAMTVDYGPRLSEAATKAPVPIPPPTIKMPPEVAKVIAASRLIAEQARAALTPLQAAINDVVTHDMLNAMVGPVTITSTLDHERNAYVMRAQQQLRMRHGQ